MYDENIPVHLDESKSPPLPSDQPASLTAGSVINLRLAPWPTKAVFPVSFALDKVSITIGLPSRKSASDYAKDLHARIDQVLNFGKCKEFGGGLIYQYHITWSGAFDIQWGTRQGNSDSLRIEWNPKDVQLQDLAPLVKVIPANKWRFAKVTRCDWAADFHHELNPHLFMMAGASSSKTYCSPCPLTHYIGSPQADRQLRVYNKAVEVMSKAKPVKGQPGVKHFDVPEDFAITWWRVEMQDRRGWQLFDPLPEAPPFAGVEAHEYPTEGPWVLVPPALMKDGLSAVRGVISKTLGRNIWVRKFKPLLKRASVQLPTMADCTSIWNAYRAQFGEVIDSTLYIAGKL